MTGPQKGADGLTFGERVRVLRQRAGMDQGELAFRVQGNRRPGTVSAWENDQSLPDGANMIALRAALDVDGHYLLTGDTYRGAATPPTEALRQLLEWIRSLPPPPDGGSDETP